MSKHQEQNERISKTAEELLKDLHTAICGNERLGIKGIVTDVKELKEWRSKMDLRTAKISGMIIAIISVVEIIFKHL